MVNIFSFHATLAILSNFDTLFAVLCLSNQVELFFTKTSKNIYIYIYLKKQFFFLAFETFSKVLVASRLH